MECSFSSSRRKSEAAQPRRVTRPSGRCEIVPTFVRTSNIWACTGEVAVPPGPTPEQAARQDKGFGLGARLRDLDRILRQSPQSTGFLRSECDRRVPRDFHLAGSSVVALADADVVEAALFSGE